MRKMFISGKKTYETPQLVSYGNAMVLIKNGGTKNLDCGGTRKNSNY